MTLRFPIAFLFITLSLAAAACDEISGRDVPSSTDAGASSNPDSGSSPGFAYCTGLAVQCSYRLPATCNNGCAVATGCLSKTLSMCAPRTTEANCNAAPACRWASNVCEVRAGSSCYAYTTQASCQSDVLRECEWGSACQGGPLTCSGKDRATCEATLGCSWRILN